MSVTTGEKRKEGGIAETVRVIFHALIIALIIRTFLFQPFNIPSGSMKETLLVGDYLFVSKYTYGYSRYSIPFSPPLFSGRIWSGNPERGDIVVFRLPKDDTTDYIKRVIGLPGDVVQGVDGRLIINGKPIKRQILPPAMIPVDANSPCGSQRDPALYDFRVRGADGKLYCRVPVTRETLPNGRTYETVELGRSAEDSFGPVTVPAGHLWLMGDNRDDSADSRVEVWLGGLGGPVPWENIGGRAEFITFSLDGTTVWWNPLTWFKAFRSGRAGTSLRNS